ncbi:hypothetical protein BDW02DRAFT_216477 [Decorospora gaudefroyi]|uniref:Uncharacterized protein n=1 Tax=Decorospora gaudefroyi TaxID=184978 RepID=A0A6A5KKZ2_9PLEO|nr:hypothetical protein BDW02DRAFT_216477 [Decorospora gaudefroyi]
MGNQPSTANHNKLSKPKTNTNSTGVALKIDSPISASPQHADISAEERLQIKEALLSPADNEFGSAVWTHKDDTIAETASIRGRPLPAISRSTSRANSRTNSLSCFGTKHGSAANIAGLADSKISLVSASHVDLQNAIKLLQEVKKKASPEDLAALHEVLEASEDHAMPVAEPPLSRKTSAVNRSSSSLTRRQSLIQTPGVGTRNSPVEGRRRTWNSWKAPQLEPDDEAKWRTSPKETCSQTPQRTRHLVESSRDALMPRARTPGELDYSHLGSLKLGSLVVTNGAPSPAPSTRVVKPHHAEDDGYFSVADGDSSPLTMKTTRRRGHVKSKSAVLPATSPLYPLDSNSMPLCHESKKTDSQKSENFSSWKFEDSVTYEQLPRCLQVANGSSHSSTHSADRFAQSYQAELPTSPFLVSEEAHRVGQDEAFGSDNTMYINNEVAHFFEDTTFAEPQTQAKAENSVPSSTSPVALPSQKSKANQRPPPRTLDSGYSSGGSVRTLDQEQQNIALCTTRSQSSGSPWNPDAADPLSANRDVETTGSMAESVILGESSPETAAPLKAGRKPPSLRIPDLSTRPSMSETLLSPRTPKSATSMASFDSTSSKSQKRLQRRRPSQAEHPVVQSCQPIPEGTIPEVPTHVRAKFERRLSHTPGVECLTHTYPTKDHILPDEPTIDSPFPTQTEIKRLVEWELEQPSAPPTNRRRRSLSFFRRKSITGKVEGEKKATKAQIGVVDLGTIATSLGTSPYDAAMSRTEKKPVTTPTHPHQLGNSLPRAKSMVNMDTKAAAEFARLHSKDLALAERGKPQPRRRSYHNLKMEAGEATASKRRPQSTDIPPVPTIDPAKLTPPPTATSRSEGEGEGVLKSNMTFSARSRERGQRVSQIVGKYDSPQPKPAQHKVDWEAHSQAWSQRRKSIGEGLRQTNTVASASHSSLTSQTRLQAPGHESSWGRFSGGLEDNYERRGVGIGGSAGIRKLHSCASAKSMNFKHQYGVELSDVPVLLQRI